MHKTGPPGPAIIVSGVRGAVMEWEILRNLEPSERRTVLANATRRRYRDGEHLFHQSDPGDSVHLVEKGHVSIQVVNPAGTTLTLTVLAPGNFFGEQALLDPDSRRTAAAVAIGTVETWELRRSAFNDLQRRYPQVTVVLIEMLASQVRRLSEQLLDAHTLTAEERVLKQLRRLAESFGSDGSATIPLTQEDLASLAGTTRPTANRALQGLVDDGRVTLRRGRIDVPRIASLTEPRRAGGR